MGIIAIGCETLHLLHYNLGLTIHGASRGNASQEVPCVEERMDLLDIFRMNSKTITWYEVRTTIIPPRISYARMLLRSQSYQNFESGAGEAEPSLVSGLTGFATGILGLGLACGVSLNRLDAWSS
jgi:hypothetical protein